MAFDSNFDYDAEPDPYEVIQASIDLNMEKSLHSEKSAVELAEHLLEEALPAAAQEMVKMATRGSNENIRYKAAMYILDRKLGKVGDTPSKANPWDAVFEKIVVENKR